MLMTIGIKTRYFRQASEKKRILPTLILRSIGTITSKVVLLSVGAPEYIVSNALGRNDDQSMTQAHIDREIGQETSLERVVHGQPGQQSIGEHESESVCGDVHGCQNSRFVPERVD